MSVPVLCRSTTVGVAFSSIAPFQHTACLLKDIYSPGTLHMRMTRSIVPRGTEMSDSDDCYCWKLAVAVAVRHITIRQKIYVDSF